MGIEENKALVVELYRRMNDREYEQMWDDLFTPDAVWGAGRFSTDAFGGIEKMKPLLVDPMPDVRGRRDALHAARAHCGRRSGRRRGRELRAHGLRHALQQPLPHAVRVPRRPDRVVKEYGDTAHARDIFGTLEL